MKHPEFGIANDKVSVCRKLSITLSFSVHPAEKEVPVQNGNRVNTSCFEVLQRQFWTVQSVGKNTKSLLKWSNKLIVYF